MLQKIKMNLDTNHTDKLGPLRAYFNEIFEKELVDEIENLSQYKTVDEGEIIMDIGQQVSHMPILISGTAKVSRIDENGNELLLYYIHPSESCAMSFTCCMEQFPSEIRAVAEEKTHFLSIPNHVMDSWMVKYPTWKSFALKMIRVRFNEMLKTIDQIAFQKLDERLANYLRSKAKATGSPLINHSHEQIAQELATSRVVVSRLLKKLENEGQVLLFRNQIKLRPDFLKDAI